MVNKISIMQKFQHGKDIEYRINNSEDEWTTTERPLWNWEQNEYRVKPNKFEKLKDIIDDALIKETLISFGGIKHNVTGDVKIVYDTHIRDVLYDKLNIGNVAKFRLVPINQFGEEIINSINESKYAR